MNWFTGTVVKRHVSPKIRPVFAIIDPMPLPRARPGLPNQAAITETKASGIVVPSEMIVAPLAQTRLPDGGQAWHAMLRLYCQDL